MKTELVELLLSLIALFIGGALEELLPKFGGVGFPILLALAVCAARHRSAPSALLFAAAAGGFVDALSRLPIATTASFAVACVAVLRWTRLPAPAMLLAYPLYQLWLAAWVSNLSGGLGLRMLTALPLATLTALAIGPLTRVLSDHLLSDSSFGDRPRWLGDRPQ